MKLTSVKEFMNEHYRVDESDLYDMLTNKEKKDLQTSLIEFKSKLTDLDTTIKKYKVLDKLLSPDFTKVIKLYSKFESSWELNK